MSLADRIYEELKNLPEETCAEVLDFVEFLKRRRPEAKTEERKRALGKALEPYRVDLTGLRFDREEANER